MCKILDKPNSQFIGIHKDKMRPALLVSNCFYIQSIITPLRDPLRCNICPVKSQSYISLVISAVLIIKKKSMVWMCIGPPPMKTSQERIHVPR